MSPSMMPTLLPHLRERDREVHRHRGLADAALAGADRDDVLHAGQRLARAVGADRLAHARAHLHVDRRRRPARCSTAARAWSRI